MFVIEGGSEMILTLDVGNLNIQIGGFEGETLKFHSRCASDPLKTEDEYLLLLRDILELYQVDMGSIEGGILTSVVPSLTPVLQRAAERLIGKHLLVVGAGVKTGLNIRIESPNELGGDMVVNAVAALHKYPKPIAVFDMETATSLSVIDRDGAYVGGALIPGLRVSVDAMADSTAQLPYIPLCKPKKLICSSTVSCMQSGAVYGYAAMTDGLAAQVAEELGEPVTVVLTGSAADLVATYCKSEIHLDMNLQMEGLRLLYEKNQGRRGKMSEKKEQKG